MVERYPEPLGGAVAGGGDAVAVERGGTPAVAVVGGDGAKLVTDFVEAGRAWVDSAALPVAGWLEGPPLLAARAAGSVEEYAEWLASRLRRAVVGRLRVLLGLSGGKDSVAALLVLEELSSLVSLEYKAMYIHVPYLEAEANVRFVEWLARRTGAPVEVVTGSRRWVRSMLRWRGLPSRGDRWCTVVKVKPMRRALKEDRRLLEAVADRPTEAPKRMRRLARQALALQPLAGRRLRVTLWLTLADVISFVRRAGLVHPDYLRGWPRVACLLCPYRGLHEIPREWDKLIEDPGLVEEAARRRWAREARSIPLDLYMEEHLWRFQGDTAVRVARAKLSLASTGDCEALSTSLHEYHLSSVRWAWLSEWSEEQPIVGPGGVAELLSSISGREAVVSPTRRVEPNAAAWARMLRRSGRRRSGAPSEGEATAG